MNSLSAPTDLILIVTHDKELEGVRFMKHIFLCQQKMPEMRKTIMAWDTRCVGDYHKLKKYQKINWSLFGPRGSYSSAQLN